MNPRIATSFQTRVVVPVNNGLNYLNKKKKIYRVAHKKTQPSIYHLDQDLSHHARSSKVSLSNQLRSSVPINTSIRQKSLIEFYENSRPILGIIEKLYPPGTLQVDTGVFSLHIQTSEITFLWKHANGSLEYSVEDLPAINEMIQNDLLTYGSHLKVAWGSFYDCGVRSINSEMLACQIYKKNRVSPFEHYVAHKLLSEDTVYFVKGQYYEEDHPVYECREKYLVKIMEAKATKNQRRMRFLHRVQSRLVKRGVTLKADLEELKNIKSSDLKWSPVQDSEFIDAIKTFALAFDEEDLSTETYEGLLKPLGYKKNMKSAFELLVKLKIWGKYEDLNVHRYSRNLSFSSKEKSQFRSMEERFKRGIGVNDKDENLRKDLTHLYPIFAIDKDINSDEVDDAVSFEMRENGLWIFTHIADPSRIVQKGDQLDSIARERFSSLYTPGTTIPMFPSNIASNLFSLQNSQKNYALSFGARLDDSGNIVEYEITPSIIGPVSSMTYAEVDEIFETQKDHEFRSALASLKKISDQRREMRNTNGGLFVDSPSPNITVEKKGSKISVVSTTQSTSQKMISEFMILVGEITAKFATENEIPILYRVQSERYQKFSTIDSLNSKTIFETEHFDGMYSHKDDAFKDWAKLLLSEDSQKFKYGSANLSTEPFKHMGLGLEEYTQSSSPIRRYLDLIVHYQIKAVLRKDRPPFSDSEMYTLMHEMTERQEELKSVSIYSKRYWILRYLERQQDIIHEAIVLSVQQLLKDGSKVMALLHKIGFQASVVLNRTPLKGELLSLCIREIDPFYDTLSFEEV